MFFLHSGLMAAGLLLMLAGFTVARFMKTRRWWLKTHRALAIIGLSSLLLGLISALIMVAQHHGPHFNSPHTYLGAATILLSILTATLGIFIFKIKKLPQKIRVSHRWSGRVTLVLACVTALLGMKLAGVI
jgi:uncharacterized membrane protein